MVGIFYFLEVPKDALKAGDLLMLDPYAPQPFKKRLKETGRLAVLAVRLAWQASPRLILGIILLLGLQALLSPLQLALSRIVIRN